MIIQNQTKTAEKQEVLVTRVFEAPRDIVFKAWTEPERVKQWWGPKDYIVPTVKIDLRVGGKYLYCMRSPDGKDYWGKGVFREIMKPERLVMTDSFADEKGNTVPASYYGMSEDWALEMLITVTFEEYQGKTRFTLKHSRLEGMTAADRENMQQGWSESFDKLAEYLKLAVGKTVITASSGGREVVITRIFDAPRERVFKTYMDPTLIPKWWGPRHYTTKVEKMEVRKGGIWRFIQRDVQGKEYAFNGVYHSIEPPERVIQTFEFEAMPGHVSLETAVLTEQDGKTKMTATSVYQTVEDRDGMLKSGMEKGLVETHERFDELLKEKV